MEVVASHAVRHEFDLPNGEESGETILMYELCLCLSCSRICLREIDLISYEDEPPIAILYPPATAGGAPRGIPEEVAVAFEAALRVRGIDANAYAVLLGRVLEIVCRNRGAAGNTLAKKLADLSEKKEIPERLVDVANGLRQLRNVGAHADLGELTGAELPVLDNLTRAILEYVYTAPELVKEAEDCLSRLKARKK
jgi:hypothetical protein